MPRAFYRRDLELLGYEPLQDKGIESDNTSFSVWNVNARAGLDSVPAKFIYIKAACTAEDAKEAMTHATSDANTYVVFPQSAEDRVSKLRHDKDDNKRYFAIEDLIWQKVKDTFAIYLCALQEGIQIPDPYITPRPVGNPNASLEDMMLNWLSETGQKSISNIRVIRAPAGVGKTSLARQLTKRLAESANKYRLIPSYVESDHWATLRVESLDQLWSMIDNSLRHFDINLRLSQSVFEHLLKSGDLVFIFDGFDELCGHNHSRFSPREVLEELRKLAKESAAKIILTTRTMYWEAEVGQAPEGVDVFDLEQFTKQQAHDFFEKRFRKNPVLRHYGYTGNVSELQQFMDNGLLSGKVRELFDELRPR